MATTQTPTPSRGFWATILTIVIAVVAAIIIKMALGMSPWAELSGLAGMAALLFGAIFLLRSRDLLSQGQAEKAMKYAGIFFVVCFLYLILQTRFSWLSWSLKRSSESTSRSIAEAIDPGRSLDAEALAVSAINAAEKNSVDSLASRLRFARHVQLGDSASVAQLRKGLHSAYALSDTVRKLRNEFPIDNSPSLQERLRGWKIIPLLFSVGLILVVAGSFAWWKGKPGAKGIFWAGVFVLGVAILIAGLTSKEVKVSDLGPTASQAASSGLQAGKQLVSSLPRPSLPNKSVFTSPQAGASKRVARTDTEIQLIKNKIVPLPQCVTGTPGNIFSVYFFGPGTEKIEKYWGYWRGTEWQWTKIPVHAIPPGFDSRTHLFGYKAKEDGCTARVYVKYAR